MTVDITNVVGVRLNVKGSPQTVNFDVKAKLEEKDRRSQMVIVGFNLLVTTKPSIVKFEVEGSATLNGKDLEISKMLEVNPETKVPYLFQKIYQNAFTAMYLLSTILRTLAPPQNLLHLQKEGIPIEDIHVEARVGEETVEGRSGEGVEELPSTEDTEPEPTRAVRPEGNINTVQGDERTVAEGRIEERTEEPTSAEG